MLLYIMLYILLDSLHFYSTRTSVCQQSPKLTLTGSDMGLVLTASAGLITKLRECRSKYIEHYIIVSRAQAFIYFIRDPLL